MMELDKSEIIERDGLRFKRKITVDPDGGYLNDDGKYTQKFSEYVIDRRTGIFYGERLPDPEENENDCRICVEEEPEYHNPINNAVNSRYGNDLCVACGELEAEEQDEEYHYEILARDLPTDRDDRSYQYWKPGENYVPPGGENGNWGKYPTDEPCVEIFDAENKSLGKVTPREADIHYACQDYRRAEAGNNGEWCYTDVWVYALDQNDEVIDYQVVGGIESDSGDDYYEEVTNDLIDELKESLPGTIRRKQEALGQLALALAG